MIVEADVVVIGAGLAGFSAALEAAEAGAGVLLIEKQPQVGGSTVLSGGSMAFAGTDDQKRQGIEDSNEILKRDLIAVGEGANDPALVDVYVDNQLDSYRWLIAKGVTYAPVQAASGQSVPRQHPTDPREMIRILSEEASRSPRIKVVTGTPAKRLVRDAATGRVTGVLVGGDGGERTIAARRGVVLTSGGFSRNKAMIEQFAPNQAHATNVGGPGNQGDGIRMAWALGAGMRDMGYVKGTFGNHPDATPEEHTAMLAIYKGAIAVNKLGKRFANESISYKLLGDACLQQPGHSGFQVFDQTVFDTQVRSVKIYDFQRRIDEGRLFRADTVEELARKINVPPDALAATVAEYNRGVDAGTDEFGRTGLVAGYGKRPKLDKPSFYAYGSTSAIIATYCGLTVDTRMKVIDVFGEPIEGLFAAGELTGGFHGKAFMTGSSLGKCVICGRLAGRNAATGN